MDQKPLHPWLARVGVASAMLILFFIGLIFTDIRSSGGWNYWRIIVPVYALMALGLSRYLHQAERSLRLATLGHELLHWLGLIGSVFLVSFYVQQGILGRFEAALAVLTLVSLAVFLAGIYIENSFLWIGLVLGGFAAMVAFIEEYLYAFSIPFLVVMIAALAILFRHHHRKRNKPN